MSDPAIEVLEKSRIAIVVSSSAAAHYPDRHRALFDRCAPAWASCVYVDEADVATLIASDQLSRLAAIVFTAGALQHGAVRKALVDHADSIQKFVSRSGGLLVMARFLAGRGFTFQPHQDLGAVFFRLTGQTAGPTSLTVSDPLGNFSLRLATDTLRTDVAITAEYPDAWTTSVQGSATLPSGGTAPLVRLSNGRYRVAVSNMGLDDLNDDQILTNVLQWLVAARTHVVVGPCNDIPHDFLPERESNALVHIHDPADHLLADVRLWANHVKYSKDAALDASGLTSRAFLYRILEVSGSIAFPSFHGEDYSIYTHMAGEPRDLRLIRQLSRRIAEVDLLDNPTFVILAFVLLTKQISRNIESQIQIPGSLTLEAARDLVEKSIAHRVNGRGAVDNLLIPTVNLYAAARLAGHDLSKVETLRRWILTHVARETESDVIWDARWCLHVTGCDELLEEFPVPETPPYSVPGKLAAWLDQDALGSRPVGLSPSDLIPGERAIYRYTVALNQERFVETEPQDAQLRWGSLESLFLESAARLMYLGNAPMWSGRTVEEDHEPLEELPDEAELAYKTADEVLRSQYAATTRTHERVLRAYRRLFWAVLPIPIIVAVAVLSAPWWLLASGTVETEVALALTGVGLTVVTISVVRASRSEMWALASPRWLQGVATTLRDLQPR
ncbi:hypothetical protein [Promicromonospora sp. NPDC050249]|uniref:hypothetical protein n=1 Tax=Promicromonospora sp. NPDC050249 TaxID=3154743 RepID=UPI0034088C0C